MGTDVRKLQFGMSMSYVGGFYTHIMDLDISLQNRDPHLKTKNSIHSIKIPGR